LGFNRESQLSITIRTAICAPQMVYFNVGAGIVADSNPELEYDETLAKAAGFLAALSHKNYPKSHGQASPTLDLSPSKRSTPRTNVL
jgi:anthranilate/para-aminobenzoate synthase component I